MFSLPTRRMAAINLAQGALGFVVVYVALALSLGDDLGAAWLAFAVLALAGVIALAFKR